MLCEQIQYTLDLSAIPFLSRSQTLCYVPLPSIRGNLLFVQKVTVESVHAAKKFAVVGNYFYIFMRLSYYP
jgi:hypothetical protein